MSFRGMIADRLQSIRQQRGITAKRLSIGLGFPSHAIHNIENGMAWLPDRVKAYLDWAGFPGDYELLRQWLDD